MWKAPGAGTKRILPGIRIDFHLARKWALFYARCQLVRQAPEMQESSINILLIANCPDSDQQIRRILDGPQQACFALETVNSFAAGLNRAAEGGVDVVLLDLPVADGKGFDGVHQLKSHASHVPVIVLSSIDDESLAVRAVHEGAQDYLVKTEVDRHLLVRSIRYAIERNRAEVALFEVEEKYRSIFENTVEGIFQTTPSGQYISGNPALARIYGYESTEDLMRNLTDIAHQLYLEPGRRHEFIRLMQNHAVVTNFESQIRRKDGSVIWISENCRAVRDKEGQVLYYEGTVEDITERKLAEERVRESENLYHSLVENLPQNIFRKDLSERFTFANKRFCAMLGKPLSDIIGKTDFDFFPPELAAKYQQDDRLILETGKVFDTIEEHQPPGGEKIYVNVVKTPLHDSQGNIIGLQGIFWDITEKKRAEERLKKAHIELARNREELRAKNEQMEEDLRMAREIQQAILPQQYPSFPRGVELQDSRLTFCHRYFPSGAVGGDFFNVVALSDTKAGVFVCDVMGHGVRSALVTAIMRALVEELNPLASDPGKLLAQINRDLRAILKQSGTPLFTTAFYLVADLENGELCYANAGHPKPFLIRRATNEVHLLTNSDGVSRPALGLFDESTYPASRCPMQARDLVVLFTDGLYDFEGPHGELFSPDWLMKQVSKRTQLSAGELFDELLDAIRSFSNSGQFMDDVCLVGMEVAG